MFDSVKDCPVAQAWHIKISLLVNTSVANFDMEMVGIAWES